MLVCKPRVSVAEHAVPYCMMTNYSNVLHGEFSNVDINVLLR